MRPNLHLEGAAEFEAMLRELGTVPANRLARNALSAAGRVIARLARQNIRRNRLVLTRRLVRSVTVRDDAGLAKSGATKRGAFVRVRARHAHLHEFGTVKMIARPFLRPAVDEGGVEAINAMAKNLGRGIEREAERLAKKHKTHKQPRRTR